MDCIRPPAANKDRLMPGECRMFHRRLTIAIAVASLAGSPLFGQSSVTERSVAAHEAFLASDALQGRGSATRDEAIAAAYVASRFQSYGLSPAPGLGSYVQTAIIFRQRLAAPARLSSPGLAPIEPTVVTSSGSPVSGTLVVATSADPKALPAGDVVLVEAADADPVAFYRAAGARHLKLLLLTENDATHKLVT